MQTVYFRMSTPALVYSLIFLAVSVWLAWWGWSAGRPIQFILFVGVSMFAASLLTIRGELSLSRGTRVITGKRTWLGFPVHHIAVRLGSDDALHLTEDVTSGRGTQGIDVAHRLEASGQLVNKQTDKPGPYIVLSESHIRNRADLEQFAEEAAEVLRVRLEDSREYKERVRLFREERK